MSSTLSWPWGPPAEGPGGGAARRGEGGLAPAEGHGKGGGGSPKRLYKAPTDYTKPQKDYTKPRQTIQSPGILKKTKIFNKYLKK